MTAATTEKPEPAATSATPARRAFDGVVCFGGEDWWYHNRGHYDMQMMRELSCETPVLYVNSIGMRTPSLAEGGMFFRRVARKLRSFRRGYVPVRENFSVLSPVTVPGRVGRALSRRTLIAQVRAAARRMGITRPLVWINCPPGAEALDALAPAGLVYQRTDRYEDFTGVDRALITGYDRRLKREADVTLFCSTSLYEDERGQCARAAFIDHGVDAARFEAAGREPDEPADLAGAGRPRAGFVGGIDAHTFWPEMFEAVVRSMPDVEFVLVGACSLPPTWCDEPNATFLGQKAYEDVPRYMAACDVLLMPWNRSPWIEACNPVKLKEYLAVGRPVVSTGFRELERYAGLVRVAEDAEGFAREIRAALAAPHDPEPGRARVREQTWEAKARGALDELAAVGLVPTQKGPPGRAGEVRDDRDA